MMKARKRNREIHTKPGSQERLISVKLMIPKSAIEQMKELERGQRHTKEDIFLTGIQTCMDHGA